MDNRQQLDEMLIRSLTQELTGEEELMLTAWLKADGANEKHYEELLHTWQLTKIIREVDKIDVQAEWQRFTHDTEGIAPGTSAGEAGTEMDAVIAIARSGRMIYRILASAAACILLTIAGVWFFRGTKGVKPSSSPAAPSPSMAAVLTRNEVNGTAHMRKIDLPDGSWVLLSGNSELNWQEPFDHARVFFLKGEAQFRVAKDPGRPFTVYSGSLSTIVLGTTFRVTAFQEARTITVRLYEGSVVVRPADSLKKSLHKEVILSPGQELVYDKNKQTAKVHPFEGSHAATGKEAQGRDDLTLPKGDTGNWYMFNNQPLTQVFGQLEAIYGVRIRYVKKDVRKLYFIGKFDKSDAVETILNQIAALNDLKVTRDHNTYVISAF